MIVLSFATIIIGTINYAVPPGHDSVGVIYALFWYVWRFWRREFVSDQLRVYVALAVLVCFPMLMIW